MCIRDRITADELLWTGHTGFCTVFPEEHIGRTSQLRIDGATASHAIETLRRLFDNPGYASAPISFARLNGVFVDTSLGVAATRDGILIEETAVVAQAIDPSLAAIHDAVRDGRSAIFRDTEQTPVLHCFHRATPAYGHFIFDGLSVIAWFRDAILAERIKVLFPPFFPAWGLDILASLGLDRDRHMIRPGESVVFCHEIVIPTIIQTANTFFPNRAFCTGLHDAIVEASGARKRPARTRHIYLSRMNQINYSNRSIDCLLYTSRTHIRFFSMRNIQALIESAGLKIVEYAYVLHPPENTEFAETWRALSPRARAVLEESDFPHVYQVVMRAIPADKFPGLPGYVLPTCKPPRVNKLKFIAFYLPQFHPIPENDAWWGKGFTEWTNTTRAQPLFAGHYQPHLPADFGYYDLRTPEVRHEQIDYARRYGIDAFCFHYYWFAGRRLLERPVEDFLADAAADFEFCLCWANENWTRRWDASEHEILVEQTYSPANDIAFIESLLPFFRDRRYLRVRGAPLLVVYRPQQIPDPRTTVRRWRQYCRANGIGEIHLVAALTHGNYDFESLGFDAGVEFPPHNTHTDDLRDQVGAEQELTGLITPFAAVAATHLARDYKERPVYRTVIPSWDNTARIATRAIVILDGTPENYERWLDDAAFRTVAERAPGERLLFINAWNEWAEGCHLEPDRKYGTRFLEATARVKNGESRVPAAVPSVSDPEPVPPPEPPPAREAAVRTEYVSLGLRTELGRWGVRGLLRYPLLYRAGRGFYRLVIKKS